MPLPSTIRNPATLPAAGAEMVSALPLMALVLWLANDHVFKGGGYLPAALTGKLSDIAGLFCFPVLLVAMVRTATSNRDPAAARRWMGSAVLATTTVFSALKLVPSLAASVSVIWGRIHPDPTDLLTLPAAGLSWLWYRRWVRGPWRLAPSVLARWSVLLLGLLATAATSPAHRTIPRIRPLPVWTAADAQRWESTCVIVESWVSKSGKEGVGITLEARFDERACSIKLQKARLSVGRVAVDTAARVPVVLEPAEGSVARLYLPFVFDNDSAWRKGDRQAVLDLHWIGPTGEPQAWKIALTQVLPPERPEWHRRPVPAAEAAAVEPVTDAGDKGQ